MLIMRRLVLLCILFVCTHTSFGQREAFKTLTFNTNVKDLVIVPFNGIAVISDIDKMHGYNPEAEEILWTVDIPKRTALAFGAEMMGSDLSPNSLLGLNDKANGGDFSIIQDTPFIQKFIDNRLFIINSFDGKMIFETTGDEIFYFQSEYLFDEDAILLRGLEGKKLIVTKFSLRDQKEVWKTILSDDFSSKLAKLSAMLGKNVAAKDEMTYTEDKIFLLAKSTFYVLGKNSGNLLWKADDKEYDHYYSSLDGSSVLLSEYTGGLLSRKESLDLRDGNTGSAAWKSPLKTKYLVLFEDWQDKMLLAHYNGFNFYDYKTGNKIWKKDPKGKGIKSVITIDKDFLYVYDDEMMLLDKDGQKKWKKDVKISDDEDDPIFFLEKTTNGKVLYVTATYANLVDYATGVKIWKKNLKLNEKRPTFAKYNETSGEFVIYNDEEIFKFNQETTERPEPYAELKLKNDKLITSLELFPNSVTITGQSELMGVDNSGKVLFHNKYTQPGELGRMFAKTALSLGKAAGSLAQTEMEVYQVHRDAEGNVISEEKVGTVQFSERTQQIGKAGYMAGEFTQQFVEERYNALQETDEYAMIFAKGDAGEKLLIKVNKQNGTEVDKIVVENNKPVYDYDPVSEDLYYSKGKEVKIFKGE